MVVNKILTSAVVGLLIIAGVLLWRLNVLSESLSDANKANGQLEQSNNQLISDLAAQRRATHELATSYQTEQTRVAELVKDLEQAQLSASARQKVIYEKANQSDCGVQPLPDDLIRLRRERTTAASD